MSNAAETKTIGTVSRAMALLRVLAEADHALGVKDVAERLGLPASTTHRLLQLLIHEGMVAYVASERRYNVGIEYTRLAGLIAARRDIVQIAGPYLREVTAQSGESCLLGLFRPHKGDMMFVAQEESPHPLRFHIPLHEPLPVVWGCSGRVILAHLSEEEVDAILAATTAAPVTGEAPPEPAPFKQKTLETIRERGYDVTFGEKIPDSVGVAAPVFSAEQGVIGSISVSIPKARFKMNSQGGLGAMLSKSARALSSALGAF